MRRLSIYLMFLVLTSFVFVPKQSNRITSAKADVAAVNSSLSCEITPTSATVESGGSFEVTLRFRNIANYQVISPIFVSSDQSVAEVALERTDFNAGDIIYTYTVSGVAAGNAIIFFHALVKDGEVTLLEEDHSVVVTVTTPTPPGQNP